MDVYALVVPELKKVFHNVVTYDLWKNYAEIGVHAANRALYELVCTEQPKYVLWHSRMYELLESTLEAIRQQGAYVIGWFSDDEFRFEDYSRWWIPYLDYCLTTDKTALGKYRQLGAHAYYMMWGSNPEVFRRSTTPLLYDVSFVGSKFGDRGLWIEQLRARRIRVKAFGRGWDQGYIPTEQMAHVYNASKVNLCFVKSDSDPPRFVIKGKIFDICMSGAFLLCEYVPGIEEFFEVGKEIVTFTDLEDATEKIEYYLAHDAERQAIAEAGWMRAQRDHTLAVRFQNAFAEIEDDLQECHRSIRQNELPAELPAHIRCLPSTWHLAWARGLMIEGYPKERWQEELDLAFFYDPENKRARRLSLIGRFPAFARHGLIRLWAVLGRLKQALRSRLATIPVLRRIKQTLVS